MGQQQLSPGIYRSVFLFSSSVSRASATKSRVIILPIQIYYSCIGIFTASHIACPPSADMQAEGHQTLHREFWLIKI